MLVGGNAVALGALAGAAAGAASAAINGGNILKGAITGGILGAIFAGVGVSGWEDTAKVLAHGVAGGFMSVVQGGKFGQGFLSAGFAKFATTSLTNGGVFNMADRSTGNIVGRTAVAAVVGGTASELGGGKFANGARTAAFAHLVNSELSVEQELAQQESLTNPTGGTIRSDSEGDGNYGAPRGNRSHRGIDITSVDGQGVVSPADGTAVNFTGATTGYPIVDITPSDQSLNIDLIRILYVGPSSTNSGGRYNVSQGGLIGNSVNLQGLGYSNGVTPHVHIQIQSGGQWVDPTPYFFPSGP